MENKSREWELSVDVVSPIQPLDGEENPQMEIDVGKHFITSNLFSSKDDLVDWARSIAMGLGFVITIQSADKLTGRLKPRVILGCDRAGYYRENQRNKGWVRKNLRKSSSKRCGCKFSLKGQKGLNMNEWTLEVICGVHNHERVHLEAHSFAGRLDSNEQTIVHEMYVAGVKPRKILTALKQRDPSNKTVLRTIYNERVKMQTKELQGGTQMQFLYKCITESGYVSFNKISKEGGNLESLFFAHPVSIQLSKMFPTVFIMDCTYKTNRFRMPLLCIVGVTSTNQTFYSAFAFISNETQSSYAWALDCFKSILDLHSLPQVIVTDREIALMNAIEVLFPKAKNILCKLHISRNILSKCKKYFKAGKEWEKFLTVWQHIVDSRTQTEFKHRLENLLADYNAQYPEVCSYVLSNWIEPYKEYFVSAWVDMFLHLDNSTTNRVESGHSHLKRFLEVSIGNLTTIWKTFNQMIILQQTEIKHAFGKSTIQLSKEFGSPLYFELVGRISLYALELLKKEEHLAKNANGGECTHKNRHALGLPCAHDLLPYMQQSNSFPLWMIHNHWKQLVLPDIQGDEGVKTEDVSDNDIGIEMEGILKRYNNTSTLQKQEIKKKLRDLMDPSATQTLEPLVPKALKGRPRGSYRRFRDDKKSTKRDPSLFEHVLMAEQVSTTTTTVRSTRKLVVKESRLLRAVRKEMPPYVSDYIIEVIDVERDGHCGYRVVSNAMGMGNDWEKVRTDLSLELQNKEYMYVDIFGEERREELLSSLDYFDTPAPFDKWMSMPDIGLVVASCYNIVFVHLSTYQSFTLLPLHSPPPTAHKIVFIGFINGNHFVQLRMREDFKLPPIISIWRRYREVSADEWDKVIDKEAVTSSKTK